MSHFLLDVSASGLEVGGYSIEVSSMDLRKPLIARIISRLIEPLPDWHEYWWDSAAEARHGIGTADVARYGLPGDAVVCMMNDQLAGQTLLSIHAEHDAWWALRLFLGLARDQIFRIVPLSTPVPEPSAFHIDGFDRPVHWWHARFAPCFAETRKPA